MNVFSFQASQVPLRLHSFNCWSVGIPLWLHRLSGKGLIMLVFVSFFSCHLLFSCLFFPIISHVSPSSLISLIPVVSLSSLFSLFLDSFHCQSYEPRRYIQQRDITTMFSWPTQARAVRSAAVDMLRPLVGMDTFVSLSHDCFFCRGPCPPGTTLRKPAVRSGRHRFRHARNHFRCFAGDMSSDNGR